MSTPTSNAPKQSSSSEVAKSGGGPLDTSEGRTSISDSVVQKIAGIAAREISGVYSLGSGASRAFGAVKSAVSGSSSQPNVTQGVKVEVGATQAAVDLNLVVEYGVAIADLAASIRRNVIQAVERMTGLQVTEVNVSVDDVHLPNDDSGNDQDDDAGSQEQPPRVQ